MNQFTNVLMIVLAVVGAIALIGVLSMWLMHGMMMGPGMMGGGIGMAVALILIVVAVAILLARSKPTS